MAEGVVLTSAASASEPATMSEEYKWKDGDFSLFKSPRDVLNKHLQAEEIANLPSRLHVISSSLPGQEELKLVRVAVCHRVRYFELQSGSGTVTTFNVGMFEDPAQLYTCVIDLKGSGEEDEVLEKPVFVVTCLSMHTEGLELFIPELDAFAESLGVKLRSMPEDAVLLIQSFPRSPADQFLQSWWKHVTYISEVVDSYKSHLPVLLYSILNHSVKVCGEDTEQVQELQRFIWACTLDSLTQRQNPKLARSLSGGGADDLVTVTIGMVGVIKSLSSSSEVSSDFTHKWSKAMLAKASSYPSHSKAFALKKVVETFKLKIIQDINSLKRLLKEAETNFYALYKCYTFLTDSGNQDALLRCSLLEASAQEESMTIEIIATLQEFIKRHTVKRAGLTTPTIQTPLIQF